MTTRTRKPSARPPAPPAAGGPPSTPEPRAARRATAPGGRMAPSRQGQPRPDGGRRRAREKVRLSFLQAWGPLIAVGAVALAALAALAINPYLVQDRLVKPTPITIPDTSAEVIPP